jgi:leucine dehydrogenase
MVIIGDPKIVKTPELLHAAGKFVHSLGGMYITAEDVGMTSADCRTIGDETPYVSGVLPTEHGGDPSPATAYGVECAMKAAWKVHTGKASLKGVYCAIEGLGNVGFDLARRLHRLGAVLYASDVDNEKLVRARKEFKFIEKETRELRKMHADIYVPCALGGVVNDETVNEFHVKVICGSANNVLEEPLHAKLLQDQGIMYVPDYVANCGGIIDVQYQRSGYDGDKVKKHIHRIAYDKSLMILRRSQKESRTPAEIADEMAEQCFQR